MPGLLIKTFSSKPISDQFNLVRTSLQLKWFSEIFSLTIKPPWRNVGKNTLRKSAKLFLREKVRQFEGLTMEKISRVPFLFLMGSPPSSTQVPAPVGVKKAGIPAPPALI